MDYAAAYDTIIQLRDELTATIRRQTDAAEDYRTIQALAAAYTLQDYTAERIAEQGKPPEGAELDTAADTTEHQRSAQRHQEHHRHRAGHLQHSRSGAPAAGKAAELTEGREHRDRLEQGRTHRRRRHSD